MRLCVDGDGPPVVKIAGLAGGVGLYHEEVAHARDAGFRVATLDTSGDRLDDPAPGPLTWDFLAGEVLQALDRLGAERAVLWGTSFGSLVSLATAARRPDRIAGLLLCSPPEPGWRPPLHLALLRRASGRPLPARTTARWFTLGFLVLNAWEFVHPTALARLRGLYRASRDARTPNRTIHEKLGLLFHDEPGLPPYELPTAVISGVFDTVTGAGASRRVARRLTGARLHRLAFSGHACAYSRPRAYARRVVAELRRLSES